MSPEQLEKVFATHRSLAQQRADWMPWWDSLRDLVLPRRSAPSTFTNAAYAPPCSSNVTDTTAIEACQKLASAHLSYITPSNETWFKWSSPDESPTDEAEAWYNRCSEVAFKELSLSNFYTEIHECFLDRVALGTGSVYSALGADGGLTFTHIPCGSFSCAEDATGKVDTYIREFTLSAHQAQTMFGLNALSERVRKIIAEGRDLYATSVRVIHVVMPRSALPRTTRKQHPLPYLSAYICPDEKHLIEESGVPEFPYLVTRFLKWGDSPYGIAPGRLVFPDIEQAQFLNRILDTLAEVAAFPRILELAHQVGEIDFRSGGRTIITPEAAALNLPREWATQGRYDIGMERLRAKQDSIRRAFFVPMIEMWAEQQGSMTATEVRARESERVLMFSPSFTLFVSDLYPLMQRVFSLLFRAGKLPPPPPSVINQQDKQEPSISMPRVVYQSKIAMILRRMQSEGIDRTLFRLSNMLQTAPQLADHIKWDECFRLSARLDGAPESILTPMRDVRKLRKQQISLAQQENTQAND